MRRRRKSRRARRLTSAGLRCQRRLGAPLGDGGASTSPTDCPGAARGRHPWATSRAVRAVKQGSVPLPPGSAQGSPCTANRRCLAPTRAPEGRWGSHEELPQAGMSGRLFKGEVGRFMLTVRRVGAPHGCVKLLPTSLVALPFGFSSQSVCTDKVLHFAFRGLSPFGRAAPEPAPCL